ncbi:hypothetical protein WMY93_029127 [Mugilogobius chulae]|uniref:RWD domain-containing protein n=1 Tax=Mugilogobius chulae TaxID=88201 RepID=A0AAW0MQF3_9GOBI
MSYLDWAESQLAEIELLSSMFPTQEELDFSDPLSLDLLRSYVEGPGSTEGPPAYRPHFNIKHKMQPAGMEEMDVTVSCAYPSEYPSVLPEITVRCSALNRSQQSQLQSDLSAHLSETCLGEVCVLSALDWLKDHLHLYTCPASPSAPAQRDPALSQPPEVFTRLWIYSHHIYNKIKRKNIWSGPRSWSESADMEEDYDSTQRGRPLTEPEQDGEPAVTLDSLRKFSQFEEAMFDPHGNRGNHMDLGQLYHFLNEKGLSEVFQMYFGIEGR